MLNRLSPPQVAIVGAGFAGIATALHLQSLAVAPLHIHLFDPRSAGRGVAYGLSDPSALLNVAVERMGLWAGRADHFLHWLHQQGQCPAVGSFLPRQRYGDYLQQQLTEGLTKSGPADTDTFSSADSNPCARCQYPARVDAKTLRRAAFCRRAMCVGPGKLSPCPSGNRFSRLLSASALF